MLDAAGFHPEHLADLRKSGLSDETIEQAGLYSVRPNDIKKVTAHVKVESMLAIPYSAEFTRYKVTGCEFCKWSQPIVVSKVI